MCIMRCDAVRLALWSHRPEIAIAVCCLSVQTWLNLATSPTVDEPAHLAASVTLIQHGRCDLYAVNPPLTRWLAGFGATAWGSLDGTVLEADARRQYPVLSRSEWQSSAEFFDGNGILAYQALHRARVGMMVFVLLGAIVCYAWAKELYGRVAGCCAAVLWCAEPLILGHGPLITTDVPAAAMMVASVYCFRRWLLAPAFPAVVTFGAVFGLALVTKFSCLLLAGLFPLLWLAWNWRSSRARTMSPDPTIGGVAPGWRLQLGQLLFAHLVAWSVIQLAYTPDCRWQTLGEYRFGSQALTGQPYQNGGPTGNRFRTTSLGRIVVPLSIAFVEGIDAQKKDFDRQWQCYLGGTWQQGGWWYFYLVALLVKLPLGTLALLLITVPFALRRITSGDWREALLLLAPPALIIGSANSLTNFTLHVRYVIPALPFLFVWASQLFAKRAETSPSGGASAASPQPRIIPAHPAWRFLATVCVAATVVSSAAALPHSLAYCNELAGGVTRGHRWLLDSNTDWGQDLYRLKSWLDRHQNGRPLFLAHFSMHSPSSLGIDFELPPQASQHKSVTTLPPGIYVISTNFLHGHTFTAPSGHGELVSIYSGDFDYLHSRPTTAWIGPSLRVFEISER